MEHEHPKAHEHEHITEAQIRSHRLARCHRCEFWRGRCSLHDGCCFDKWLITRESMCPDGQW